MCFRQKLAITAEKMFNFNSTFCDFVKKCLSNLKVKTAAVNVSA